MFLWNCKTTLPKSWLSKVAIIYCDSIACRCSIHSMWLVRSRLPSSNTGMTLAGNPCVINWYLHSWSLPIIAIIISKRPKEILVTFSETYVLGATTTTTQFWNVDYHDAAPRLRTRLDGLGHDVVSWLVRPSPSCLHSFALLFRRSFFWNSDWLADWTGLETIAYQVHYWTVRVRTLQTEWRQLPPFPSRNCLYCSIATIFSSQKLQLYIHLRLVPGSRFQVSLALLSFHQHQHQYSQNLESFSSYFFSSSENEQYNHQDTRGYRT